MTESWIVEIRRRLEGTAAEAAAGAVGDAAGAGRAAALVPLFVDAGELWTVLTSRVAPPGQVAPLAFPGALVEGPEGVWAAAVEGGEVEAGLEPRVLLDLGRLDPVPTPGGVLVIPCVAALPTAAVHRRAPPASGSAVEEVVPVPLNALANPTLVESRPARLAGATAELTVFHLGRRRVWGVTARIAGDLLSRLGMHGPMTEG